MQRWLDLLYNSAARGAESVGRVVPAGVESKLWRSFSGRQRLLRRYRQWSSTHRDHSRQLLWLHAPSVGEALMALPVLERVTRALPSVQIAFTFFSPSAEDLVRSASPGFADYLPFDSRRSVDSALDSLAPTALVFSKSDVWPNLVAAAAARGVRTGLLSASMRATSRRGTGLALSLTRRSYGTLDLIGAASAMDARALIAAGARECVVRVTGDARYDQAWHRAHVEHRNADLVRALERDRPTIVAGSTWPSDESVLLPAFDDIRRNRPATRIIIAPHEITASGLERLERMARGITSRVTRLESSDAADADILIVDRTGVLADLYRLGTVAYVGGGFHRAGLHSLVEPAVYRVPAVIGPHHANSRDAGLMLAAGGITSADSVTTLAAALERVLARCELRSAMSEAMGEVVSAELGAADSSFEIVRELLRPV